MLRLKKGLTLTKVAAALDIDQSTLSKIENCKRALPQSALTKVATLFDIELKLLENEYFSEQIAEIIYSKDNRHEILKLVDSKILILRKKNKMK